MLFTMKRLMEDIFLSGDEEEEMVVGVEDLGDQDGNIDLYVVGKFFTEKIGRWAVDNWKTPFGHV